MDNFPYTPLKQKIPSRQEKLSLNYLQYPFLSGALFSKISCSAVFFQIITIIIILILPRLIFHLFHLHYSSISPHFVHTQFKRIATCSASNRVAAEVVNNIADKFVTRQLSLKLNYRRPGYLSNVLVK